MTPPQALLDQDSSLLSKEMRIIESKLVAYLMAPEPAGRGFGLRQVSNHFRFDDACLLFYYYEKQDPEEVSVDYLHLKAWEDTYNDLFESSPEGALSLGNINWSTLMEHLDLDVGPRSKYYAQFHRKKKAQESRLTSSIDGIVSSFLRRCELGLRSTGNSFNPSDGDGDSGDTPAADDNNPNITPDPETDIFSTASNEEDREAESWVATGMQLMELISSVWRVASEQRHCGPHGSSKSFTTFEIIKLVVALWEAGESVSLADETKMPPSTAAREWCRKMGVSYGSVICHQSLRLTDDGTFEVPRDLQKKKV